MSLWLRIAQIDKVVQVEAIETQVLRGHGHQVGDVAAADQSFGDEVGQGHAHRRSESSRSPREISVRLAEGIESTVGDQAGGLKVGDLEHGPGQIELVLGQEAHIQGVGQTMAVEVQQVVQV